MKTTERYSRIRARLFRLRDKEVYLNDELQDTKILIEVYEAEATTYLDHMDKVELPDVVLDVKARE